MNRFLTKGLKISAGLHGFFLLILISGFIFNYFSSTKRGPSHVFQLETVPKTSSVPSKATPVASVETKKNTVKKAVQEKKISYNDFVKNQGVATKNPKATTPSTQPITAPKIQTADIKKKFEEKLSETQLISPGLSGAMDSLLEEYQAYVRSVIDSSWKQPEDFSGYNNETIVEFDVDKLGYLCNIRITKSSGCRIFDQSVEQAFQTAAFIRPTPNGKMLSGCRLTFAKKLR
ncbi:hypothetical protein AYO37_00925 [Opitutia bacterium SCGC AG-212-L18]|nr:hypothetical protein AYO37_00925 [Opitutae bacterium SCGC AG-212-L18]